MPEDNLIRHYNEKYFRSTETASKNVIGFTTAPSDRYEACLNYFVNHNIGGDILEMGAGEGLLARSS